MDKILKTHDYLDSLPEIGKVLSFGSILRVAEDLNEEITKFRNSCSLLKFLKKLKKKL